jgi:iron complex outermembrane receptor protein
MKRAAWLLAMNLWAMAVFSQFTLKGEIVDGEGRALPGANLVLKDLDKGTVAGPDGTFTFLEVPGGSHTLRITFLGYQPVILHLSVYSDLELGKTVMQLSSLMMEEVMVTAIRAGERTPVAFTDLEREEIQTRNFGQDVPYLLSMTPSLVVSSDAGHGIGYTSMRIRGTDANRINVTINGIPLNDAESHSVFWVDLPDIATSVESIQVQRGVGTSTNGSAAFGASVNLMTRTLEKEPYATYEGTLGSFGTYRNAISAGTGLLGEHLTADVRLSGMHSDGYIDRSWTDLSSHYISVGYHESRTLIKGIVFSGTEELYQAWNGVPSDLLGTHRTFNALGAYTDAQGNPGYYDNQVDHYQQDHYQLHLSHEFTEKLYANVALHYTRGAGYYEEYKEDEPLSGYGLEDIISGGDTLQETDLIRQKWLDNHFYGWVGGLHYRQERFTVILGGGWNRYDGDHFGTVIWARHPGDSEIRHRWYEGTGLKTDWNGSLKTTLFAGERLSFFADLQVRGIGYTIGGNDDDLREISQQHSYLFFNPKGGMDFQIDGRQRIYLFVGSASREPNRSNFIDADPNGPVPQHETLLDCEAGYGYLTDLVALSVNIYWMDYTNQLVMTGEINDVGSPVMTNVKESYRTGIELSAGASLARWIRWDLGVTLSSNRIPGYVGYVDNWDYWSDPEHEPYQVEESLGTTHLSFSPGLLLNSQVDLVPLENLHLNLSSRVVGRQFIDNTSSQDRSLDPYIVNDLRITYAFSPFKLGELSLQFQVLNLFGAVYESNAWVYRYYSQGNPGRLNGFYPQAGRHYMAGIRLSF